MMNLEQNSPPRGQHAVLLASFVYGIVAALDIFPLLGQRSIGSAYSLLFIALVLLWGRPALPKEPARQLVLMAVFGLLAWSTASTLWAPPQSPAISRLISLSQACITFGALMLVAHVCRRWITLGLAIGATLAALMLFTQGETGTSGRLSYGSVDENITAYTFAVGIAAYIALINHRTAAMVFAIPILTLLVATIQTGSRTGLAAILATIIISPILMLRSQNVIRSLSVGGIIIAGFTLLRGFALRWEGTPDRLKPLIQGSANINDSGRSTISDQYLQFIDQWWLLGTGLAGGNDFIRSEVALFSFSAHNTALRVWIETGIIGLLSILVVYVVTLHIGLTSPGARKYLVLFIPSLAFSLTLGGLELSLTFWATIALVAGAETPNDNTFARPQTSTPVGAS